MQEQLRPGWILGVSAIALTIGLEAAQGAIGAGIGTGAGGGSSDEVTINAALGLSRGQGFIFA